MKNSHRFLFFLLIFAIPGVSLSQLTGSYNVGAGQVYTTLSGPGGFFAAVNSQGLSGNVTVNITSAITENGPNALDQWTEFGAGNYTITIRPSAAVERVISGSVANGMIRLNGADRVTIDGRFGGSGKYLRFRNTNGSNPTIMFINDARRNTITYCYIESNNSSLSSAPTRAGTILFSTTTGTQGNDSNVISYCDISDRSDAAGFHAYAVFSSGTATTTNHLNSDIQIINNNIYNFWIDGNFCGGLYITTGTGDNWIISGNSFYQTAARISSSGASGGWNIIFLNYTGINNCTVTGNYIGGSAPNCGGTPWTASSDRALQFPGIRAFIGSTSASSIQNNTIANINFTTTPQASGQLPFVGILVEGGLANIGNITGNTIGSSTGTGSISLDFSPPGGYTQFIRGIDHRSSGNVQNNVFGSMNIAGNNNDIVTFDGIIYASTPSSAVSISNNTIGSPLTANSISNTRPNLQIILRGITSSVNTASVTIDNNIVANLDNSSARNNSVAYGIIHTGSGRPAITNNSVNNIAGRMNNTTNIAILGIASTSNSTLQTIQGNTIYALRSTTAGVSNTNVTGLDVEGSSSTGTISKNRLYDLTNTATGLSPSIFGINAYWGSWTASNNQICITNGEPVDNSRTDFRNYDQNQNPNLHPTALVFNSVNSDKLPATTIGDLLTVEPLEIRINPPKHNIPDGGDLSTNGVNIYGINDISGQTWNYYYNTIYIGGSATTGTTNSYCYVRQLQPTAVTFRNNIFFNARNHTTGLGYAVGNIYSTPATNWPSTASNYNLLISSNASYIGEWGAGVNRTIDEWRTSSGGDLKTWSTVSSGISASNLFSSISGGNLNIQSGNTEAWIVSGKGIAVSGEGSDFGTDTRTTTISGGTTDIGSDEFSATPPGNPLCVESGSIGSGTTSSYSLWGRTLLTIEWGTGGTSYPSTMNVRYYSGVNPNNVIGGGYSNSYWEVLIGGGTFSGTTYDIIFNFGDNETFTITPPNTDTRLAKKETTAWDVFLTLGSSAGQTLLDWPNLTARTNFLTNFSEFALTDADSPLPVEISYFGADINNRDVTLIWVTEMEINNRGFSVERRDENGFTFGEWKTIGFVNGKGNSNIPVTYKFSDNKLKAGNYQYRLKQIDYNGNYEYFSLTNPSVVAVGKPAVFDISQNYPNPSNPSSKIDYQIPFDGIVSLKVYDAAGREVLTLVNESKQAGYYTATFDGGKLSSGIYFYMITAESGLQRFTKSMKMVLVK